MNNYEITIICLIYQSPEYARFVFDNIHRHTPELSNGKAKFLFIANDPTKEMVDYLSVSNMPYVLNYNRVYTENELFRMGYAFPEYINRVYSGYNFGIKYANTPIVTLINSDNAFSEGWLFNMYKRLNPKTVVSSTLVQPHEFINPKNGSKCKVFNCGNSISNFDEEKFIDYSGRIREDSWSVGNPFMPLMLYKSQAKIVNYYPEGNLHAGNYNHILFTGDHAFINKLESVGVQHITTNDSIVYHFQEGEKYKKL